MFQGFKLPKPKQVEDQNKDRVTYPAKIQSISSLGVVTIHFQRSVFVPKFSQTKISESSPQNLRNLGSQANLTLEQVIDSFTLDVRLKTSNGVEKIDWRCTNFTKQTLLIQLDFTNPLQVSSNGFDNLIVKFLQPNLFLLSSLDKYLFSEEYQHVLTAQIPPQFPSKQAIVAFNSISAAATKSAPTIIAITLILQIIAKKVITSMFIYYSVLQIILLINLNANVQLPASVNFLSNMIDGIINLSSFDKKMISDKINLPASTFQENSLLSKLGFIAFAIVLILVFVGCILIARKLNLAKKLKVVLQKVMNFIFWNFLIRYFQVAFINLNLSALVTVQNPETVGDEIVSTGILVFLYSLVVLIIYILLKRQLWELSLQKTKDSIGNLYTNLDVFSRKKVLYGVMFYIQRALIVLLIAFKIDFCLQWVLIQLVLMLNTSYLLWVRPYSVWSDGIVDYCNTILLLITEISFVLVTPFVTDPSQRYLYGIYFDTWIGVGLVSNLCYIVLLTIRPIILKIKRFLFQRELRQQKRLQKLEKDEKIKKLKQRVEELKQEQVSILKSSQSNLELVNNSAQNLVILKPKSFSSTPKQVNQLVQKSRKNTTQNKHPTLQFLSIVDEEPENRGSKLIKQKTIVQNNPIQNNTFQGQPIGLPQKASQSGIKLPSFDELSDTSNYVPARQVPKICNSLQFLTGRKIKSIQREYSEQPNQVRSQIIPQNYGVQSQLEFQNVNRDKMQMRIQNNMQSQAPQQFGQNQSSLSKAHLQQRFGGNLGYHSFQNQHQIQSTQHDAQSGMSAKQQLYQLMQMRRMQPSSRQYQQSELQEQHIQNQQLQVFKQVQPKQFTTEQMQKIAEIRTQEVIRRIGEREKKVELLEFMS